MKNIMTHIPIAQMKNVIVPQPPKFNYEEELHEYNKKFNEYFEKTRAYKYNVILHFTNLWLKAYNINIKNLLQFKNIKKSLLLSNKNHNTQILKQYKEEVCNLLKIEHLKKDMHQDDYIIKFMKNILAKIDYMLTGKNTECLFIMERKVKTSFNA